MIKNTRQGNGLKQYASQIPFLDTNEVSKNYFGVIDFPSRFCVGKNSFNISPNGDNLVKGSQIYIDVVDSNNKIVYHEILSIKNNDLSRTVVVHIYPDTPPGHLYVYIAGRVSRHPVTGHQILYSDSPVSPDYRDVPNILWVGKSRVIVTEQNNSNIIFTSEPRITYKERLASFAYSSGSKNLSRLTHLTSSITTPGSGLSIKSTVIPYQFGKDSAFNDEANFSTKLVDAMPNIDSNVGVAGERSYLPEYFQPSVLNSSTYNFFRSQHIGGTIVVRNINVDRFVPKDAVPGTSWTIPDYSSSVLDVPDPKSLVVSTPFYHVVEYPRIGGGTNKVVFDQFYDQKNFTMSFYDTNVGVMKSWTSESFVSLEFSGIEPSVGTVDKIRMSYKPVGSYGDFIDLGEFPISEQNILIDTSSVKLIPNRGLVDKPIGYIDASSIDNSTYWEGFKSGLTVVTANNDNNATMPDALSIVILGTQNNKNYAGVRLRNRWVRLVKDTEYKLKFVVKGRKITSTLWHHPMMDVYISGSHVVPGIFSRGTIQVPPLSYGTLGTLIGTVDAIDNNSIKTVEYSFVAKEDGNVTPVFIMRSGRWVFGRIEIIPRKEIGFSPNHVRLNVPLNRFEQKTELLINVDYLNQNGVQANLNSKLNGVYFQGGRSELSQSIVVIKDDLLAVSSSLSWRVTGTISGSDIRYYDGISGSNNTPLSRLEISGRGSSHSAGGELSLAASTQSMTGGTRFLFGNENATKATANDYVHTQYMGTWNGSMTISCSVKYPIMNRSDTFAYYSGNENISIVHLMYDMNVMAVGYSGSSYTDYMGSYIWGGSIRNRVALPVSKNIPLMAYDAFISTASMDIYSGYERFGNPNMSDRPRLILPTSKENAFRISATHSVDSGSGTLDVEYRLNQIPGNMGEEYDVYIMTNIKVMKMEYFIDRI